MSLRILLDTGALMVYFTLLVVSINSMFFVMWRRHIRSLTRIAPRVLAILFVASLVLMVTSVLYSDWVHAFGMALLLVCSAILSETLKY